MSTLRQIEANRRNALKSTGPRSVEGKAVSRLNALKTGIDAESMVVPGEDPRALEELTVEYHERFRPSTPDRRFLVDSLVNAEWQIRRLRKVEAQIWAFEMHRPSDMDKKFPLGLAFMRTRDVQIRLQRRIDAAERTYRRALEKLERPEPTLIHTPTPEESDASAIAPPPQPLESQSIQPAIGFVPSTSKFAPPRPPALGGHTFMWRALEAQEPR